MVVSNLLSTGTNATLETWLYIIREITDVNGNKWIQVCTSGSTAGTFNYGTWYKVLDTQTVKDYVIEQGTYSDGWEYTKWNSGKIELWGDKSLSFPATTSQGNYVWRTFVSIDLSSKLTKIIGGSCPVQYSGVVPQVCRNGGNPSTAEIMIVTGKTFEAFTTTVPIYIIGKWK